MWSTQYRPHSKRKFWPRSTLCMHMHTSCRLAKMRSSQCDAITATVEISPDSTEPTAKTRRMHENELWVRAFDSCLGLFLRLYSGYEEMREPLKKCGKIIIIRETWVSPWPMHPDYKHTGAWNCIAAIIAPYGRVVRMSEQEYKTQIIAIRIDRRLSRIVTDRNWRPLPIEFSSKIQ